MTSENLIKEAQKISSKFYFSKKEDISAGSVGAALLTKKGNIYTGICLDLACGIGFCAEHSAIAEMLKHRETHIEMIVAVKNSEILPPCGRCRELMMQIDKKNKDCMIVIDHDHIKSLEELLPNHWL